LVGGLAGIVVSQSLTDIVLNVLGWRETDLGDVLGQVPYRLLPLGVFVGTLLVGIRLAAAHPPEKGGVEPRLSKSFYMGTVAVAWGVPMLVVAATLVPIAAQDWVPEDRLPILLLFGMATLLAVLGTVTIFVLLYRAWGALQDGHARTSPGRAVGFLFIPIFGFYWIFQVLWGFAKDFNALVSRHSMDAARLPPGLFLAQAILIVSTILIRVDPVIGFVICPISYVLWLVMVTKICDGVNALPLVTAQGPSTQGGDHSVSHQAEGDLAPGPS
jgi:hypothetical protein